MEDLVVSEDSIGEPLRDWLLANAQPACVIAAERLPDGRVLMRALPTIDPALIARVRITFAQYREALMNLT